MLEDLGALVAAILLTDVTSGVFHWWEDAYGDPFWPIIGTHVTRPGERGARAAYPRRISPAIASRRSLAV